MGGVALVWFLVVYGNGVTTIPVPYETQDECAYAAQFVHAGDCVPQAVKNVNRFARMNNCWITSPCEAPDMSVDEVKERD